MASQEDKGNERWTNFAGIVADRMSEKFPSQIDKTKFIEWLTSTSPELRAMSGPLVDSRILGILILLSIPDGVEDGLADFIAGIDVNSVELPEDHPYFSFEYNLAAVRATAKYLELSKGKSVKDIFVDEIYRLIVLHYSEREEIPTSLRFMMANSGVEYSGPPTMPKSLDEAVEASIDRRAVKLEEQGVHPRLAEARLREEEAMFKEELLDTNEEDAAFDEIVRACPNPQKLAELILATKDGKLPV